MGKIRNKKIIIIPIVVVVSVALFFIAASYIVLDECASPCRHDEKPTSISEALMTVCPDMCVKVTLLDWILGKG